MKQLIVNADDFGQTRGVNAGIVQCYREGIVRSTTLMANGAAFEDAVLLANELPGLGVGVHLNFAEGQPLCLPAEVSSLLGRSGEFLSKFALIRRHLSGRLNLAELRREIEAQIDRVCRAGIAPTHVDSHKNIHGYPAFFGVIARAAESRGIRAIRFPLERFGARDLLACPRGAVRALLLGIASRGSRGKLNQSSLQTTDFFAGTLRTGQLSASWLAQWIGSLREGRTEMMVHPGFCDDELLQTGTRLTTHRESELHALTDRRVLEAVRAANVTLTHFGQEATPSQAETAGCLGQRRMCDGDS